ncbi:hypothetical protein [Calothrix sp. 336/3]|uniref:hypothetical protein n=2 Tax=Calothrix sp. 336/3 TaxID=1337936 RepID=UPI0006993888
MSDYQTHHKIVRLHIKTLFLDIEQTNNIQMIKQSVKLLSTSAVIASTIAVSTSAFSRAEAASFTFNLDCVISGTVGGNTYSGGNTCAKVNQSFGTVTIKDSTTNSKTVDVIVDLAGNKVHKVLDLYLNYNDSKFQGPDFNVSAGSGYSIQSDTVNENKLKASGYKGSLDFNIKPKATTSSNDGFNAIIALKESCQSLFDLNASDFNYKDTLNQILAAVHIGNYGNNPGISGGNSIWVGSSSYYQASIPPKKVPEPTAIASLGIFAAGAWKMKKKNQEKKQEDLLVLC